MSRRADADALERLRTRNATWTDRQDEALAGLLALARSADRLAPAPAAAVPQRRRQLSALTGLTTTAVAGGAFVVMSLTTGAVTHPTPGPSPTLSAQGAVVARLLEQVRADLTRASTAKGTTQQQALYSRADVALARAQSLTRGLPRSEQAPFTTSSTQLQHELDQHGPRARCGSAVPHPSRNCTADGQESRQVRARPSSP